MSLANLTVAVTGSRRASELAALISHLGGKPYVAPTIGVQSLEQLDKATDTARRIISGEVEHVIFMTGPGIYAFFDEAAELGIKRELIEALNKLHVVARSSKPARALKEHGIHVDLVPADNTSEGIAKGMKQLNLQGKTVMVLWHGEPKPFLREQLESQGAKIFEAMFYNYSLELGAGGEKILKAMGFKPVLPDVKKVVNLITDIEKGLVHAITFTSPPSARNLFQIAANHNLKSQLREDLNRKVIVVAVGPPTREAIESNGVKVDVMPENYKLGPMIKGLEDYVKAGKGKAIPILEKNRTHNPSGT